jgi:RimJ/RimL family protein N-acetyltransferase
MKLLPIEIDERLNESFNAKLDCKEILSVYPDYYKKVGFIKPWIGYFITDEQDEIVAGGGYKGKPKDGKIEIAYGTFLKHERKGIATEVCRQLVLLALKTDKSVKITARTLPEHNASTRVLKRNGFELLGTVWDEDDGDVWEWEYKKS